MNQKAGISLAVDCLFVHKSQVLLVKRKYDPFKDAYALPGGFVETNESLSKACARELYEETGVKVASDSLILLDEKSKVNRDPRSRIISIVFGFRSESLPVVKPGDDAAYASFHELKNLPRLAFDHQEVLENFINNSYINF